MAKALATRDELKVKVMEKVKLADGLASSIEANNTRIAALLAEVKKLTVENEQAKKEKQTAEEEDKRNKEACAFPPHHSPTLRSALPPTRPPLKPLLFS